MTDDVSFDSGAGKGVAFFRNLNQMTQGALAERIGVAQQTVAKIEAGTRPLKFSEAALIADVFGVKVDDLILGTSDAASLAWVKQVNNEIEAAYGALDSAIYRVQAARIAGIATLTRIGDFDNEPEAVQGELLQVRRAVSRRVDAFVQSALEGSMRQLLIQQDSNEVEAIKWLLHQIEEEWVDGPEA